MAEPLSTEEMQTIIKEVVLDKPNSVEHPDAIDFRRRIRKNLKEAPADAQIYFPPEQPDIR